MGASYTRHNADNDQKTTFLDALGMTEEKLNASAASIFEDGDYIDASDVMIKNQVQVPNGKIVSPRSGKPYSFYGQNYALTNLSNTVYNIDGVSYLEGEIYADEDALVASGIEEEAGIDHTVGDWKGENLIRQVNGAVGSKGGYNPDYLVKVFVPLVDSPWASKHQTEKLVKAQYLEKAGVQGTKGGLAGDYDILQGLNQ